MHRAHDSTVSASAQKNLTVVNPIAVSHVAVTVMAAHAADLAATVLAKIAVALAVRAAKVVLKEKADSTVKAERVAKVVLKEKVVVLEAHVVREDSVAVEIAARSAAKAVEAVKADLHAAETAKAETTTAAAALAVAKVVAALKEKAVVDSIVTAAHAVKVDSEEASDVRSTARVVALLKAEIPHVVVASAIAGAMRVVARTDHAAISVITHLAVEKVVLKNLLKSAN